MTATQLLRLCGASRLQACANLFFGLLVSAALPLGTAHAEETSPEPTIARLEFRVLDVKPDGKPSDKPLRSFRYSYMAYTAGKKRRCRNATSRISSDDGILRLPKNLPPFGRVRVWITADDLDTGYRSGYGEFSYRLDENKPAEPATIQLRLGIVLTGRVLDADTGKPIVAAEVAP